jgi:hypothetical protein
VSSCSPSWLGLTVGRSENRRFIIRRSLSASRAKDTDARSTAVGRQSSIPVISAFLIPQHAMARPFRKRYGTMASCHYRNVAGRPGSPGG